MWTNELHWRSPGGSWLSTYTQCANYFISDIRPHAVVLAEYSVLINLQRCGATGVCRQKRIPWLFAYTMLFYDINISKEKHTPYKHAKYLVIYGFKTERTQIALKLLYHIILTAV